MATMLLRNCMVGCKSSLASFQLHTQAVSPRNKEQREDVTVDLVEHWTLDTGMRRRWWPTMRRAS